MKLNWAEVKEIKAVAAKYRVSEDTQDNNKSHNNTLQHKLEQLEKQNQELKENFDQLKDQK